MKLLTLLLLLELDGGMTFKVPEGWQVVEAWERDRPPDFAQHVTVARDALALLSKDDATIQIRRFPRRGNASALEELQRIAVLDQPPGEITIDGYPAAEAMMTNAWLVAIVRDCEVLLIRFASPAEDAEDAREDFRELLMTIELPR